MVEGLQLIVAVLLMILGVTIVVTSGKELLKKKARAKGRIIDDVPKDPYQASPVQFFRQLQPGIPISAADSRLI